MLSNIIAYGMFLSHQELKDLTDRKIAKAQMRWLKNHSYPFEIGASGKPKVLRSLVIDRLQNTSNCVQLNEPNFDAIRQGIKWADVAKITLTYRLECI